MTVSSVPVAGASPHEAVAPLASLSEDERMARFDRLQERMGDVWRIMRLNEPGESVVVIPSVTLDGVKERSGTLMQAMRGTLPVPAAPAPPAPPADDLRDVDADRTRHRRVLPGPAARHHPEPRQISARPGLGQRRIGAIAQRQAARAATVAGPHTRSDPRSVPIPSGPLQHDSAGARPRPGARHSHVRRRSSPVPARDQDRLPPVVRRGGSAPPVGLRGPAQHRRRDRGVRRPARRLGPR